MRITGCRAPRPAGLLAPCALGVIRLAHHVLLMDVVGFIGWSDRSSLGMFMLPR